MGRKDLLGKLFKYADMLARREAKDILKRLYNRRNGIRLL